MGYTTGGMIEAFLRCPTVSTRPPTWADADGSDPASPSADAARSFAVLAGHETCRQLVVEEKLEPPAVSPLAPRHCTIELTNLKRPEALAPRGVVPADGMNPSGSDSNHCSSPTLRTGPPDR